MVYYVIIIIVGKIVIHKDKGGKQKWELWDSTEIINVTIVGGGTIRTGHLLPTQKSAHQVGAMTVQTVVDLVTILLTVSAINAMGPEGSTAFGGNLPQLP